MKEKLTPHIIAVMAFVVFVVLGLACASVPKDYKEISPASLTNNINEPKIVTETRLKYLTGTSIVVLLDVPHKSLYNVGSVKNLNEILLEERIEADKVYRVYMTFESYDIGFIVDRIDGLMSVEEAQARIDKRNADKKVAEEAQKQKQEAEQKAKQEAWEAATKNFIIMPENWNPVHYTKTDLFKAVAASKDLKIYSSKVDAIWGGSFLWCVSDLKFVRQNGTDITFSSDDNSITQIMSIDQRSGLQAGQKVRVYYDITRSPVTRWDVIAIEKR